MGSVLVGGGAGRGDGAGRGAHLKLTRLAFFAERLAVFDLLAAPLYVLAIAAGSFAGPLARAIEFTAELPCHIIAWRGQVCYPPGDVRGGQL